MRFLRVNEPIVPADSHQPTLRSSASMSSWLLSSGSGTLDASAKFAGSIVMTVVRGLGRRAGIHGPERPPRWLRKMRFLLREVPIALQDELNDLGTVDQLP